MQRNVLALKINKTSYIIPTFFECLLEHFQKNDNSVMVNCMLENGKLILEREKNGFELRHSPECPLKSLLKSDSTVHESVENCSTSNVGVATSVIVESSDSHILFTKRTHLMRSSPNVWVVPGGYLENDETIFAAGIREVQEETGLDIRGGDLTTLGLWENVYPLLLGIGMPKTHTLTIYTHVLLNENQEQLTKKIIPNPDEVSSYCWLNKPILLQQLHSQENILFSGKQYIVENKKLVEKTLDYSSMFNKWLWTQSEPYSGVNFAIRKWLEKVHQEKKSKF